MFYHYDNGQCNHNDKLEEFQCLTRNNRIIMYTLCYMQQATIIYKQLK